MKLPTIDNLNMARASMGITESQVGWIILATMVAGYNLGLMHSMAQEDPENKSLFMGVGAAGIVFWLMVVAVAYGDGMRRARKTDEYARIQNAIKYLRERVARSGNKR